MRSRPGSIGLVIVGAVLAGLVWAALGSIEYVRPRTLSSQERASLERADAALERTTELIGTPVSCQTTYLGRDDDEVYVWAVCGGSRGAVSLPVLLTGSVLSWPKEYDYGGDVRRLFPDDLADVILEHPERLHDA